MNITKSNVIKAFLITLWGINYQITLAQEFNVDIHSKKQSFFKFIDHVEIIPLEETKNSLLSRVEFYFKIPNGIGIIEKQKNSIVLFAENGKYMNSIYKFGNGPEEYANLGTTWVEDDTIRLYSSHSRNVLNFSLEGKYINTKSVKYPKGLMGGNISPYQGGYVVQLLDMPQVKSNYDLMFLNSEFKINSFAAAKSNPHPFPVNQGNRFSHLKGQLIWKKQLSDSIFVLKNNHPSPFMKFNFGEDWAWKDPLASSSQKMAFNTIWKEDSKVWEVISKVNEQHILLTFYFRIIENGKGIIDRQTGKFHLFDMRKKDKEDFNIFFLEWEGDRLVSSLQAYDVEEFLENLDESQYSIAGGLKYEDFKYSENPVLLKIKFKIPD